MTNDRPLLGIAMMTGFCVLAPLGDAIAKLLGGSVPLGELLLVRFVFQAVILLPIVWLGGQSLRVSRRVFGFILWRTLLHILGIGMMFTALRFLPLADTIAIAFVMPFIMLLLGKYVLHEQIGRFRLGACVVGFVGTLFVVQPSFAEVGLPALLPLGVAVVFALFMLVTRQIAKDIGAVPLQAISGVIASVVLAGVVWVGQGSGIAAFSLVWPDGFTAWMFVAIGLVGTFAHLLMTWSLRFAPSATLAPMQYLELPMATIIGLLLFSELPNGLAALGIVITIAAGLAVILRERFIATALTPS